MEQLTLGYGGGFSKETCYISISLGNENFVNIDSPKVGDALSVGFIKKGRKNFIRIEILALKAKKIGSPEAEIDIQIYDENMENKLKEYKLLLCNQHHEFLELPI